MAKSCREVVYVSEPPTISIVGGVVHVTYEIGNTELRRAMSVRTLEKSGERIERALDRLAKGDTDIIVDD